MSRVGKQKINIPSGVKVTLEDGLLKVTGPQGTLERSMRPEIKIEIGGDIISLKPEVLNSFTRKLWGTYASHILNMIAGVTNPFVKKLIIEGIGYKAEAVGENLNLALGFSHPVKVAIPKGIKAVTEKGMITVSGIDKEKVGQFAAHLRSLKLPEPYKGKGIRYEGEVIRRKAGKKAAATTA